MDCLPFLTDARTETEDLVEASKTHALTVHEARHETRTPFVPIVETVAWFTIYATGKWATQVLQAGCAWGALLIHTRVLDILTFIAVHTRDVAILTIRTSVGSAPVRFSLAKLASAPHSSISLIDKSGWTCFNATALIAQILVVLALLARVTVFTVIAVLPTR